ncbi:MAG: hypothetical protein NUV60_02555 [Patescibacteria group bacterium]|nr:hypothetical protein [Patescibacteria group bacterium]
MLLYSSRTIVPKGKMLKHNIVHSNEEIKEMKVTLLGITISNEPEVKRFGLTQAEGAMQFAKEPAQIQSVLGVVVGVLGYENTVAADVAATTADVQTSVQTGEAGIAKNEREIAKLQRRIAELQEQVAAMKGRKTELADIAKLFAVQPTGK